MVIGGGKKVVYLVIKVFSGWYCVDGTFRNVFRFLPISDSEYFLMNLHLEWCEWLTLYTL